MFSIKPTNVTIFAIEGDTSVKEKDGTSYFKFSVSEWNANKNQDGTYKTKNDKGYEPSWFATAFGGTAHQIANALEVAKFKEEDKDPRADFTISSAHIKKQVHDDAYNTELIITEVKNYIRSSKSDPDSNQLTQEVTDHLSSES